MVELKTAPLFIPELSTELSCQNMEKTFDKPPDILELDHTAFPLIQVSHATAAQTVWVQVMTTQTPFC
jgi:hypothetical protein